MRIFLSFNSKDATLAETLRAAILRLEPAAEIFFSPVSLGQGFWLPKLAAGIAAADAFLFLIGPRGVGPWQEVEYHEAFDRHVTDSRFAMVPVIAASAHAPGLPFFRQLNWIELSALGDEVALSGVVAALKGEAAPAKDRLWKLVQPYRGLEAMTEANADYFFGRERETEAVLAALASKPNRLPLLIGASGTGKSSIAQAGVLSTLKSMRWPSAGIGATSSRPWPEAFRNSRGNWAWLTVRPGDDPFVALASAFVRLWTTDPIGPERGPLARRWAEGLRSANSLADLLDATEERLEAREGVRPERILLYLDQGEEIYSRAARRSAADANRFSELLATGLSDPRLTAFGSLRADFFDRFQADQSLFNSYEHINVPPLDVSALDTIVRGPARALGASFEDDQTPLRIARAAANEAGALPLLSYMLTDMWTTMVQRDDGILRLPVNAIDVGGVLARRAEEFLRLEPASEMQLKRLLTLRLVLMPAEGAPIRRQAVREECSEDEWSLVERLSDYPWRLVVAYERDSEVVGEIAHEALLHAWPRLSEWLREEREFLVFKSETERQLKRWNENEKDARALLVGLDLARAEAWVTRRPEDLSQGVTEYIEASVEADRAEKEKQLRQARELARVRDAMLRRSVMGLGVAVILALAASRQWMEAERQAALALRSQLHAEQAWRVATELASKMVFDLAQRFKNSTGVPQAVVRDVLEQSRRLLDELPADANAPLEVRRTRAAALNETAKSLLHAGDVVKARATALSSLDMFEKIAAFKPSSEASYDVSLAKELLANIEGDDSQTDKAIALLKETLAIREALFAKQPDNVEWRGGLAQANDNLGKHLQSEERLDEALSHYLKALAIRQELATSSPDDLDQLSAFALSLENVGTIESSKGNHLAGTEFVARALTLRQRVAASRPNLVPPQRELAFCLELLGDLHYEGGQLGTALQAYREASGIREKVANNDPGQHYWQRDFILNLTSIGNTLTKLGQTDEAIASYRAASDRQLQLATDIEKIESGESRSERGGTANALGNLAWHALLARRYEQALISADRALSLKPDRDWIILNRAHALLFMERIEEAKAQYSVVQGKKMLTASRVPQKAGIESDFDDLKKAGLHHPAMDEILEASAPPKR